MLELDREWFVQKGKMIVREAPITTPNVEDPKQGSLKLTSL